MMPPESHPMYGMWPHPLAEEESREDSEIMFIHGLVASRVPEKAYRLFSSFLVYIGSLIRSHLPVLMFYRMITTPATGLIRWTVVHTIYGEPWAQFC